MSKSFEFASHRHRFPMPVLLRYLVPCTARCRHCTPCPLQTLLVFSPRLRRRCGRDASCPTPPAQIPACGFPAPGSSGRRACARPVTQESARPLREVGWCAPALPVRHTLPLRAPSHRHPLPHVDGSPGRRGRCGAPTPAPACAVRLVVAWASLVEPGLTRVSHVPDPALHAYHGLRWTPAAPRDAHQHAASVEASGACKPSPSACWP